MAIATSLLPVHCQFPTTAVFRPLLRHKFVESCGVLLSGVVVVRGRYIKLYFL